ncbi:TonB-dependent receptor [Dyadobacter tibetensis]|uniref:TonB-dependent receptor n=1 Tax=Dyadobacter tibetensis TaxID=1211851 RepID=UPI0004723C42|nr:TonB-dependent receptor [Dyadobacter tibetensis]
MAHHKGKVVGTVVDEFQAPLVGLSIRLMGTDKLATTNEKGFFAIQGLPDGIYDLEVSGIGFDATNERIEIKDGITVILSYQLLSSTHQLTEVVVSMRPLEAVISLNKLDIPLRNLPLSASIVSAKILQERGADDLGDALKNVSGIRANNTYGGFQYFTIRGFSNFVLLVDGVRDERHNLSNSAPSTNLANVASVEVLKGPASVLYGHSALGGVINIIRKKPTDVFEADFSASFGSFHTRRLRAGAGGALCSKLRYRVDFGLSQTEGYRRSGSQTQSAYLSLDYRPTDKDQIVLSFGGNQDWYDTDAGIPMLEGGRLVPGMKPDSRYNDPQDFLKNNQYNFQILYTHQFNKGLKLSNQLSYYDDNIDYFSTEELSFTSQQDSLKRSFPYFFNHLTKPIQNQLELSFLTKTGTVAHRILAGYSLGIMGRKTYNGKVVGPALHASVPVVSPQLNQGFLSYETQNYKATEENVHGIYLQDFVEINPYLKVLIGLRYDIFDGNYYTDRVDKDRKVIEKGEVTSITSAALTYRLGLVYQPWNTFSIYGSYSTYFKPTRRFSNNGQTFDPETGLQAELGAKVEVGRKWTGTAALYYMRKNNQLESLPGGVLMPIGSASSKGFELEVQGQPLQGLQIMAGYTFSKATYLDYRGIENNPIAGNQVAFAPKQLANLWVTYEMSRGFLRNFSLSLGGNYMDKTFTSTKNSFNLPAYTLLDAALAYRFGRVGLRLNVNNLLDEKYYANAIYTNQFSAGPVRNYLLTMKYTY